MKPIRELDIAGIDETSKLAAQNFVASRTDSYGHYIDESHVSNEVKRSLAAILSRNLLPENPYMELVPMMRRRQLSRMLWKEKESNSRFAERLMTKDLLAVGDGSVLFRFKSADAANSPCGLEQNMRWVNASELVALWEALKSGPTGLIAPTAPSSDMRVITSLVGDCIFYGKLKATLGTLQLNHDFIVAVPAFDKAIKQFSEAILQIVRACSTARNVVFESMSMATVSRIAGAEGPAKFWLAKDIRSTAKNAQFMNDVKATVIGKRRVYWDALYKLRMKGKLQYVRIRRCVALYHDVAGEPVRSFAFYPLESLVSGIFVEIEDAKEYLRLHGDPSTAELPVLGRAKMQSLTDSVLTSLDSASIGPMYSALVNLVSFSGRTDLMTDLRRGLSGSPAKVQAVAWEVAVACLLLTALSEARGDDSAKTAQAVELGQAAELQIREARNHVMALLSTKGFPNDFLVISARVGKIFNEMLDTDTLTFTVSLVDPGLLVRLQRVLYCLEALELSLWCDFHVILDEKAAEESGEAGLRDALSELKRLSLLNSLAAAEGLSSAGPSDKKMIKLEERVDEEMLARPVRLPGLELHYRESSGMAGLVIDVAKEYRRCAASGRYPAHVVKEAVLMQYIVDSRLDSALEDFHYELLSGIMVPTPMQSLIESMKKWNKRFILWRTPDSKLMQERKQLDITAADLSCHVFKRGKGKAVYGTHSAVTACDPERVHELLLRYPSIVNTTESPKGMSYRETLLLALQGESVWRAFCDLGGVIPGAITVTETYVFEGGDMRQGMKFFVDRVLQYVIWFNETARNTVLCLELGGEAVFSSTVLSPSASLPSPASEAVRTVLDFATIKSDRALVEREVRRAILSRSAIVLRAVLTSDKKNPVILEKHLCFAFRELPSNKLKSYVAINNRCIYEGVFTTQAQAVEFTKCAFDAEDVAWLDPLHFDQYQGYAHQSKQQVCMDLARGDTLSAYRAYMRLALVRGEDALLADITRMLTGPESRLMCLLQSTILVVTQLIAFSRSYDRVVVQSLLDLLVTVVEGSSPAWLDIRGFLSLQGVWNGTSQLCKLISQQLLQDPVPLSLAGDCQRVLEYLSAVVDSEAASAHATMSEVDKAFKLIQKSLRPG